MTRTVLISLFGVALSLTACGSDGTSRDRSGPDPRAVFAYDRDQPLAVHGGKPRRMGAASVRALSYRAADGTRVPALFVTPRPAPRRGMCVIFQGGYRGTKEQVLPFIGVLAGNDVSTLTIDPRYHGARARRGADPETARRNYRQFSKLLRGTVVDLRRGLDYLERRPECDRRRIGYIGISLGGFLGATLAGVDQRVQAIELVVIGADWRRVLEHTDAILPRIERRPREFRKALKLLAPTEPGSWVGRISPRPVLLVNGRTDRLVVPEAGRALQRAAKDPKEVLNYNGDHVDVLGKAAPVAGERMLEWMVDQLTPIEG